MAKVVWEITQTIWCDRLKQEAHLMEQRVYADEMLAGSGQTFQVKARKCSCGEECNLIGYSCRWAFTNPFNDPFAPTELAQ